MRTEIPIPICADDVVESDNTETVNSKTPKSNPDPNLRTELFIFIAFLWLNLRPEPVTPGLVTFRLYKPGSSGVVASKRKVIGSEQVSEALAIHDLGDQRVKVLAEIFSRNRGFNFPG